MNVIVGAGLAAVRAAAALREAGSSEPIVMVGAEREPPYERPPLSKELLRGEMTIEQAHLHDRSFYRDNAIDLMLGMTARRLDLAGRAVELDDGRLLPFRQLLIATGSTPRRLKVPGEQLANVLSLRTAADATLLSKLLGVPCRVVVVGAGLIGLEVAAVARSAGNEVTVLESAPQPLARLLPSDEVAASIAELHRDHGTAVRTSATVSELRGTGRVEEVVLATGERLPADVVVVAVGVVPATDWLVGSGLPLDDGVVVDAELRTEVSGVLAAGDVARAFHPAYGRHLRLEQYGSAQEHGIVAGRAMAGVRGCIEALPGAGSEQFGVRMHVVGLAHGADRVVVRGSVTERSFIAFFLREGAISGAFVMGRPRELPGVRKLVASRARLDA